MHLMHSTHCSMWFINVCFFLLLLIQPCILSISSLRGSRSEYVFLHVSFVVAQQLVPSMVEIFAKIMQIERSVAKLA